MPRPTIKRQVAERPAITYFKPQGIPMRELEEVAVTIEGLEAMRLIHLEGMTLEEAAGRMSVSRHTLGRVLGKAHKLVADALVNGKALSINGGEHTFRAPCKPLLDGAKTVAFTVDGDGGMQSLIAPRFGRAEGFVIVNLSGKSATYLKNEIPDGCEAGPRSAMRIKSAGAEVLVTGRVGQKARLALEEAGIDIIEDMAGRLIKEVIEALEN